MGGTEVQTRVAPLANGNFGGSGLQPQLALAREIALYNKED